LPYYLVILHCIDREAWKRPRIRAADVRGAFGREWGVQRQEGKVQHLQWINVVILHDFHGSTLGWVFT
jgi:hypothetical protein